MKICVVLLLAIYGALAQRVTLRDVRNSWKPTVAPFATECLCESHGNPQALEDFFKIGIISDEPCDKCLLRCIAIKRHSMSPGGVIDAQTVVDNLPYVNLQLVRNCTDNLVEPDLCQKTYLGLKCIYDELSKIYK